MGLPVQAKSVVPERPAPSASSKALSKGMLTPVASSSSTHAGEGTQRKSEVIVTPDLSRAAAAALAANGQSSSPAPARTADSEPPPSHETSVTAPKDRSTILYSSATSTPVRTDSDSAQIPAGQRLARVTAYWAAEGDYYTGRGISATGVRLHDGLCAVDPSIIPYGSVVKIAGLGTYLAVDTGSAVISRIAAREGGHTCAERNALVVDLFFESRRDGEEFTAAAAKYAPISWWTPMATNTLARVARSLFAEEDWLKIESKQL